MRKYRTYKEELLESLKDNEEASAYLKACLDEAIENDEPGIFQMALRDVVEAHGGVSEIAEKMEVGRESFYKSLSKKGKPRFSTIIQTIKALGIEIEFRPAH